MWIRWTFLSAAVAALTACAGVAPASSSESQAGAPVVYPSMHNQLREIGWE